MTPREIALKIASILDAKHGEDIQVLDVQHLTSVTDYFVIASARNSIAVRAIAEELEEKLAESGIEARRKEGYSDSRWVVLDYASVIVHIFHVEEREYYNIERLWMDGTNQVPFVSIEEKARIEQEAAEEKSSL